LDTKAKEKLEGAPIHKPGVYAIFGWISPRLRLHVLTIPVPRPWPGVIIVGLVALAVVNRSSISFPSLKAAVLNWIGRLT